MKSRIYTVLSVIFLVFCFTLLPVAAWEMYAGWPHLTASGLWRVANPIIGSVLFGFSAFQMNSMAASSRADAQRRFSRPYLG